MEIGGRLLQLAAAASLARKGPHLAANKIQIVGIGDDGLEGLTSGARQIVERAELVIGARPSLAVAADLKAEKVEIGGDLEAIVRRLEAAAGKRVVVLTPGDPLFYGTARFLCDRLGKDRFEVTPHVSSMQLAFARVKESWDDAYLTNLATQPLELIVEKTRTAAKVGVFTTDQTPPSRVAQALIDRKIDYFTAYVCENLGSPDERVTHAELAEIAKQEFAPLNVLILLRKPDLPDRPTAMAGRRLFGNPDEAFLQSMPKRGLLTPAEVRAVALSLLDIGPTSTVWDVGAGSGSVAIEAAQIASGGQAYAIEMDPEDYSLISSNAERFGVRNLTPILGKAPEAWAGLAAPDAVFVGGTGRQVRRIVELAFEELRPGGRLVANIGSVENIAAVREALLAKSNDVQVRMINLARGNDQLERLHFEAVHPTFLVSAVKK
jgi:precorrin-6Y C5,15-methyltransferase (decarboxylating)